MTIKGVVISKVAKTVLEYLKGLETNKYRMPRIPLHLPRDRKSWNDDQKSASLDLWMCTAARGRGFRTPKKTPRANAQGLTRGDRRREQRELRRLMNA